MLDLFYPKTPLVKTAISDTQKSQTKQGHQARGLTAILRMQNEMAAMSSCFDFAWTHQHAVYVIEGRGPLGTTRPNKKSTRSRVRDIKENKCLV